MVNGAKSLFRDITETKERLASWVFRVGLAIIGALGTYVLYQVNDQIRETRATVNASNAQTWDRFDRLKDAVGDLHVSVETMSGRNDVQRTARDQQVQQINTELSDHEKRIRNLEGDMRMR